MVIVSYIFVDLRCCTNLKQNLWSNGKLCFKSREFLMNSVEFIFQSRKFLFVIQDVGKEYNHKLHKVIPGKPVIIFVVVLQLGVTIYVNLSSKTSES